MSRIGVSGCFGSGKAAEQPMAPIDDIDEVEQMVADIETTPSGASAPASVAGQLPTVALLIDEYVRRLRLLTWAVAIMAIVMIMRETD